MNTPRPKQFGHYILIYNQAQLDRWHKKRFCHGGECQPTEYPCLVRDLIDAGENGYSEFLTLEHVEAMAEALLEAGRRMHDDTPAFLRPAAEHILKMNTK